jgi:Fe2+ transport system protein B
MNQLKKFYKKIGDAKMGLVDDSKKLCEDITSSYDSRVKAIEVLVRDVQMTCNNAQKKLGDISTERKRMSQEQKKALSDFATDLNKNVDAMIKEFHNAHVEMSEKIRKNGEGLRKDLAKGETDRLNSFKSMMGQIQKRIDEIQKRKNEIETYAKNKLKEFHDDHTDMSEKLKKNLTDYVEGIISETRNLLTGFESERKRIADDLQRMATNWQNMAAAMAERRGVKAEVKEEIKVKPIKESVEKKVSSGNDLESKVLKFIEKHPKGVKISDMERLFGVPRVRLGQISNRLLNDGKVRKEEKLYFPL